MASELLTVDGVWKRYGDHDALRDVRFHLESGEAVGYLGPNGAGKSTTFRILAGLTRPTRGSARVQGWDPYTDRVRALRRLGALVETPGVPPYLSGSDLLEYVAKVKAVSSGERRSAVRRAADAVGVADVLDRPFGTLSTGLARRMLLASTLVGEPEILLLDEPTLGLDPAARADLRHTLRALHKEGLTLLISTHLLDDVQEVCDRVLFLRNGTLVGDERVRLDGDGPDGRSRQTMALHFAAAVARESLTRAAGPDVEVTLDGPNDARLRFEGGDAAQTAILAGVIRSGLPLLTAATPEPDLARRYLERVGREDET
ncbi:MAG: ABC transporter ATP-binding protein [Thermoplasmata archaeon]|nr:ABC transporter ATP-binding protein [Thermoplasmata archaeon]